MPNMQVHPVPTSKQSDPNKAPCIEAWNARKHAPSLLGLRDSLARLLFLVIPHTECLRGKECHTKIRVKHNSRRVQPRRQGNRFRTGFAEWISLFERNVTTSFSERGSVSPSGVQTNARTRMMLSRAGACALVGAGTPHRHGTQAGERRGMHLRSVEDESWPNRPCSAQALFSRRHSAVAIARGRVGVLDAGRAPPQAR